MAKNNVNLFSLVLALTYQEKSEIYRFLILLDNNFDFVTKNLEECMSKYIQQQSESLKGGALAFLRDVFCNFLLEVAPMISGDFHKTMDAQSFYKTSLINKTEVVVAVVVASRFPTQVATITLTKNF